VFLSIASRKEIEVWWLQLIGGITELALGFWAAGYYGRSAVLLVARWQLSHPRRQGHRGRLPRARAAPEARQLRAVP
jgi:hypothetical protein